MSQFDAPIRRTGGPGLPEVARAQTGQSGLPRALGPIFHRHSLARFMHEGSS